MNKTQLRQKLKRRAIAMELGGFAPPKDPFISWFGRVLVAKPEQYWPTTDDKPMHALCQLNLTELPFKPKGLEDLAMVTVFIGPENLPIDAPNGTGWCLRAYKELDGLVPLSGPATGSAIKAFPMKPRVIDADFPCHDDLDIELPEELEDEYEELFENVGGFKLGGWPSLIQSEIFWAPFNQHPFNPEYVFQIDSTEKGRWAWGDSGTGYFGRGKGAHSDEWTIQWQCY